MEQSQMHMTWFITGTSSGFGRMMTELLLARGDRVVATLRAPGLEDLAARYPDRLAMATLDVSDPAAVRAVVERAFAEMGRIDVVVNNAGYGLFGAAEEVTDEQIRRQIDTNLIGSIAIIRAALPHLRAQGGGRVLQVSSEGGQIAYPNFSLYHATKWGIEGFVESVAQEVAPFGIEFTIAEPGPSRTNFGRGLDRAEPLAIYDRTPSGDMRRVLGTGGFARYSEPIKVVAAIIDSVQRSPAPKRLAFGSESYARIRAGLLNRLAELDAHKELSLATDESPV